ncbi:unnamed protein product [Polarella glacialis]|uniref:Uncharacterized protein n=1 Tax=Polarella glacialis TaxID=89957 RepID=A0A813L7W1_POLGL|nr:unnamed protein product [Polarella glacialis]
MLRARLTALEQVLGNGTLRLGGFERWPLSSLWQLPGSAAAFGSAARVARKKKHKLKTRYANVPDRDLRQKGGDFPVQLRPTKLPQVRDLQDTNLDPQADEVDRVFKPKPHRVREALNTLRAPRHEGTENDTMTVAQLKLKRSVVAPEIPHFNPERDLSEEDAASIAAYKARALAKRNYKWMPNPHGSKPGPLGTDPQAEASYYSRYFDGRPPTQDRRRPVQGEGAAEELVDARSGPKRRERISPKQFWVQPEHVTPDPPTVAFMNSRELKYSMWNEAYLIRKWRNAQPEGRAAGLPAGAEELWLAFGYRAAELACGRSRRPKVEDAEEEAPAECGSKLPPNRCSLSTTLRFLQAMASVQAGPYSSLQQLVLRVLENLNDLRPHQCFFLLQAMSRLRLRHQKAPKILQRLSLAWRALPEKKFVKAANAAAKLDLGGQLWAKPLKLALAAWLPRMSGRHLSNLKGITIMELLDEPLAMKAYLQQCEQLRDQFVYSRHLQMVELHVHLIFPDLWKSLDEHVRLFLQEVRTAAESSRNSGKVWDSNAQSATDGRAGEESDSDEELEDSDSDSDHDSGSTKVT